MDGEDWLADMSCAQSVCGFRAWEFDTALFLRELYQLGAVGLLGMAKLYRYRKIPIREQWLLAAKILDGAHCWIGIWHSSLSLLYCHACPIW